MSPYLMMKKLGLARYLPDSSKSWGSNHLGSYLDPSEWWKKSWKWSKLEWTWINSRCYEPVNLLSLISCKIKPFFNEICVKCLIIYIKLTVEALRSPFDPSIVEIFDIGSSKNQWTTWFSKRHIIRNWKKGEKRGNKPDFSPRWKIYVFLVYFFCFIMICSVLYWFSNQYITNSKKNVFHNFLFLLKSLNLS